MIGDHQHDVIVVGVGGMGSATVHQLARRGASVLGLEQYDIPNSMGSSHGVTRIIRLAYYEDPSYVPLLRRAYALWRELEAGCGERLLHITGSVDAGPPNSFVFEGSRRSCEIHGLQHEVLNSSELRRRFPGYRLPRDSLALFQPDGGFLLSERCIVANVTGAQALGAEVHGRETVLGWEPSRGGFRVNTDRGSYRCERLVVTAGAWAEKLLPQLRGFARPERQVLAWLQPLRPKFFSPAAFPVFNLLVDEGRFYGLPVFGVPGFKFGRWRHLGQVVDPDNMQRDCGPADEQLLRGFASRYFPDGIGPTMALQFCMFVNSPDEHFIIDHYPGEPGLVFGAGFSGHGFKFCSVVGEVLADLATVGSTEHDVRLFRLSRFHEEPLATA